MPNCIRLWDSLLADEKRFDFLNYICAYLVISCRQVILKGDFARIMESLQTVSKEISDISKLIRNAEELKYEYLMKLADQ